MMAPAKMIIDAQVHAPHLAVPLPENQTELFARQSEALIGAMDAVGVTHAIIAPRHDAAMGAYACAHYPGRVARVVMVDADTENLDAAVARAAATPGVVGLRQVVSDYIGDKGAGELHAGKFDRLFAAAERARIPMFLLAPGHARDLAPVARAYPALRLIVDHFGLRQYRPLTMDPEPAAKLADLIALAKFANVAVKFCGAQLLSSQPYPHADMWPKLRPVIDAFGTKRLMWASDFTRLRMVPTGEPWRGTYAESLHFIRDTPAVTDAEKADLLGRTAREILGWPGLDPKNAAR